MHERLGQRVPTITPDGTALPCHTARMLPGLAFPDVKAASIARHLVPHPKASTAFAAPAG